MAYKCYHCGKSYYDMHDLMEHKNRVRQTEPEEDMRKHYRKMYKREREYVARKQAHRGKN